MEDEVWLDIQGFPFYQVSNYGRIRSLTKKVNHSCGTATKDGKILRQHKTKKGYSCVGLTLNGKVKTKRVHRLVALTFKENPDKKQTVNHKDGIKSNNNVSNLEWATNTENTRHAWKIGLCSKRIQTELEKTKWIEVLKKPIYSVDFVTKNKTRHSSITECAKYHGVSHSCISRALIKKTKIRKGFNFQYVQSNPSL